MNRVEPEKSINPYQTPQGGQLVEKNVLSIPRAYVAFEDYKRFADRKISELTLASSSFVDNPILHTEQQVNIGVIFTSDQAAHWALLPAEISGFTKDGKIKVIPRELFAPNLEPE